MDIGLRITTSEQAKRLNRIAEQYPYEIWVHARSGQADAKSMLSLMLLTIEDDVRLVVDDSIDTSDLENDIEDLKA